MYFRLLQYKFEYLLVFHLILGILAGFTSLIVIIWVGIVLVGYGILPLLRNGNRLGRAHLAAAYLAGFEMTVRASRSGLPHEITKYSVILLLILGLFTENQKRNKPVAFVIFFLLLLPSIFVMDLSLDAERIRQSVSFNLSGPLCLTVSVWYFYKRPLSRAQLASIFQMLLLAITTTLGFLIVHTPSVSQIKFSYGANFEASGYGPNQMASILGFGLLIIITTLLFKAPVFRLKSAIWILVGLILYRGLLTFSRGGMAGPLLAILIGLFYYWYSTGMFSLSNFKKLIALGIFSLVGLSVFYYVNVLTDNLLYERYTGQQGSRAVTFDKYTSGRSEIFRIDWEIFKDYPLLGIGPGMGNDLRVSYGYGERVAAHIEFSRLWAEHGILGILATGILLLFPVREFLLRRRRPELNFLLLALLLSTFAFMSHSATRVALPMFMYGLAFVWLLPAPSKNTGIHH